MSRNRSGTNTIITDENIQDFVDYYMDSNPLLPTDLGDLTIGQWDVSRVTNMSNLFSNRYYFDEPLNDWDVSNVTNMRGMFNNNSVFNQPLNDWNVSNVTDMSLMFRNNSVFNQPLNDWNVSNVTKMNSMFSHCTEYNQPLDHWDVSSVTNMNYLFTNCSAFNQSLQSWDVRLGTRTRLGTQTLEMFVGSALERIPSWCRGCSTEEEEEEEWEEEGEEEEWEEWEEEEAGPEVNAYQVHAEVAKINLTALTQFLSEKIPIFFREIDSGAKSVTASFIDISMKKIMENGPNKEERLADLSRIMKERLNKLRYSDFPPLLLQTVAVSINYAKRQSNAFRSAYAETFTKDTCNAYGRIGDTSDANMSCAQGALERIFLALVPAGLSAIAEIKAEIKSKNPSLSEEELEQELNSLPKVIEFNRIDTLINKSPETQIPLLIPEWYRLHRGKDYDKDKVLKGTTYPPFFEDVGVTNAAERRADLRKYLLNDFPDEGPLIDEQMKKIADYIGYDDDDFSYGGRRKKRRATIRRKKIEKPSLGRRRKSMRIQRKKIVNPSVLRRKSVRRKKRVTSRKKKKGETFQKN